MTLMKILFSIADERPLIWLQYARFRSTLLNRLSPSHEPNYDLWPLWSLTYMMDSVYFTSIDKKWSWRQNLISYTFAKEMRKKSIFREDFLDQKTAQFFVRIYTQRTPVAAETTDHLAGSGPQGRKISRLSKAKYKLRTPWDGYTCLHWVEPRFVRLANYQQLR